MTDKFVAQRTARRATTHDIPAMVRVINAAYRVEDFFVDGDRTNAKDLGLKMAGEGACFLLIDGHEPDEVAGAVFVQIKGERGYFGMLSVDPRRQGEGLGRALVTAAEDYCRAAGCKFLDLDVVNLRLELPPFYRKLGYAPFALGPFPTGEKLTRPAHVILMTKPLVDL